MRKEPVAIGGLITGAVALAGAFGLELTAEQLAGAVALVTAVVAWVTRRKVTPSS